MPNESDNKDGAQSSTVTGLTKRTELPRPKMIRLLIAFWLFGLCNNVGYVIALTAAHDFLTQFEEEASEDLKKDFKRECNIMGTGVILLADIVPAIFIKMIAPFLPLMIHVRLICMVLFSAAGFSMAAIGCDNANLRWMIILGIISLSLSSGLGESSLLAYTVFFSTRNILSTWSSGTGAAGIVGAVMYSSLREAKVSGRDSLLIMLIWPTTMAVAFWGLVPHPKITKPVVRTATLTVSTQQQIETEIPNVEDLHTVIGKLKILRKIVIIYTAPFSLVYLFEYFINQALFELLYFPNDILTHENQYRWYQTTYQIGVFIARSSMNVIEIDNLWMLAFLQATNLLILLLEVFFGFLYFVLVCMVCIFWEGIIAGTSYVNTYRRISTEVPPLQREFSMAMNSFGDAIMITSAGLIAIPVHTVLCKFENPYEKKLRTQNYKIN